jgi:hypothetical protein
MFTKRKVGQVLVALTPLMLVAGAALAANSGIGSFDTPMNNIGSVIKGAGYVAGGVGTIGVIHHIRSGSWLGMLEHLGLTVVSAAAIVNYSTYSPTFGGSAAALVHGVATHPMAHLVAHAATRLVG